MKTPSIWHKLLGLLPEGLQSEETLLLLSPSQHLPLLSHRRAQMLLTRVRLFAALFAVLTPLWIIVDMLTLPRELWQPLALLRLAATLAFYLLLKWRADDKQLTAAYQAIGWLFAIPTAFYIGSHWLLQHVQLAGLSAAIGAGYAFLPFVLLAGLAVFPLTVLESLLFSIPTLLGFALSNLLDLTLINWPSLSGELWLLSLLAGVASLAGASQLAFIIVLVRQAIRDPLTGVFSRRSGEEVLALLQANRSRQPLSLAFFDIDHFKAINDGFGHDVGDAVIIALATLMQQDLRPDAALCRSGGEEFLLLQPGVSLAQAQRIAERLRARVASHEMETGGHITISLGVAHWPADTPDLAAVLKQADKALYEAKRRGRNCVVVAEAD